jgi:hypothetical protein
MPTLFEHAGGEEALHPLEQSFTTVSSQTRSSSPCSVRDGPITSIT